MTCLGLVVAGWILSVCIHEFSHALVAHLGGDTTVRERGYLTLNPLKYADPMFSFVIPVLFLLMGGIALPGGAVYIRMDLLRSRLWRSACVLAGPLSNAVLAVVAAAPFLLGWLTPLDHSPSACALAVLVNVQVMAVVLNLLPLPPLDGFGWLAPWLPKRLVDRARVVAPYTVIALFVAISQVPELRGPLFGLINGATRRLGVDMLQVSIGWSTFHRAFWSLVPHR